ncbi:MAG: glycoside hydrolase family 3 C-terminal domain-containing protein [Bacteroidales bacterium]|jgi:beta-glucosidase|nr:glycoside hydrolase family 3 C-terminal domain-containing protein [Bacteroidales bacterium]
MIKKGKLTILLILLFTVVYGQNKIPVYGDNTKPLKERVEDALSRMTLEEKIAIIHAQSKFCSPGVARLGIPELWMTDGPHGIRPEVLWDEWEQAGWTNDSCFAFPALTCLAATWDEEMSLLYGVSIGEEARYREKDVLLGPGVNIYRSPLNGRNFEYLGEDPYLSSKMVVPYIKGVQQNGVATCVKHFALNNQETDRFTVNVNVDDRALYEIYLPAFKAAVQEGGTWAIMGSYNKYRGQYGCHNQYLLIDILRKEWGFEGTVISDWGGTHDTRQAVMNGLDMEFGTWTNGLDDGKSNAYDNYFLARPYLDLISSGEMSTTELDDKVRHVLRLNFLTAMNKEKPFGAMVSENHILAGRTIAEEGIVLLKNKGDLLPVNLDNAKVIAVIGENAIKKMTVGGGSSSLKAKYEVSPLEGLINRVGSKAKIIYARGYVGTTGGTYNGVDSGQDLSDERSESELISEACEKAKNADYVIFIGGLNKCEHQDSESADRFGLELPYNQDKLISELAKVNKNLVVVNISGNAISMPWLNEVSAVVQGWYMGSEAGNALAAVLVGDVNPSGKLPFTFPEKLIDNSAHSAGEFPGSDGQVTYSEGIYVGYRWHEKQNIKPLFSFGHGLSYTQFKYGMLKSDKKEMTSSDKITFTIDITNSGSRSGAEIVQLYISDPESYLPRPVKELKGFKKVKLLPGETKSVSFTIDKPALSFFDPDKHQWVAEPGEYAALVGASSSDIKSQLGFLLK